MCGCRSGVRSGCRLFRRSDVTACEIYSRDLSPINHSGSRDKIRGIVADLITGGAVLEYGPTEISPPFGRMFPRPACLCRPRPLARARTTAENRGFSTWKGKFARETGSQLTLRWREMDSNF